MATPQDHYDRLLARHYSWMFGVPFEQKVEEQTALLRDAGVHDPGIAADLGCGSGFQTVAIAGLGAACVHAIDTSATLLRELRAHARGLSVRTHEADLMTFDRIVGSAMDTVVCMGDTLTHLASKDQVAALLGKVADGLREGGRLVLSWRDLSRPPVGLERFVPLRSSDDRIMVCFLEDRGETVLVHDLVHARGKDGWQFQTSAYPKLKLPPGWVRATLIEAGLDPVYERTVGGMTVLAATR